MCKLNLNKFTFKLLTITTAKQDCSSAAVFYWSGSWSQDVTLATSTTPDTEEAEYRP